MFEGHHRRGHRNPALLLDLHPVGARAPRGPARLDLARDMDRAARDEQFLGQRRLARVGVRDDGDGAAVGVVGTGSGPANWVFEADRKSAVWGTCVSIRIYLWGRRVIT